MRNEKVLQLNSRAWHQANLPHGAPESNETFTLRAAPYAYIHLSLVRHNALRSPGLSDSLDSVTVYQHIHSALSRFLGIHGTAIMFDILKVQGDDAWIRTATDDASAVVAAVSQWSSAEGETWIVQSRGTWLGGLVDVRETTNLFSMER